MMMWGAAETARPLSIFDANRFFQIAFRMDDQMPAIFENPRATLL
jgi:hypothetical protein